MTAIQRFSGTLGGPEYSPSELFYDFFNVYSASVLVPGTNQGMLTKALVVGG